MRGPKPGGFGPLVVPRFWRCQEGATASYRLQFTLS
jgi:hypothetical protein